MISRHTRIEELVELKEGVISFMRDRNIRCIRCGDPTWDTIEEAARKVGYSEDEIDKLVEELNLLS